MALNTKTEYIILGTVANVTLPENAAQVVSVAEWPESGTAWSNLSVVSTAPAAGEIQFTGTADAPSNTLTLNAAPATAGGMLLVRFVPIGAVPAAV
jgi:hypothetical protein